MSLIDQLFRHFLGLDGCPIDIYYILLPNLLVEKHHPIEIRNDIKMLRRSELNGNIRTNSFLECLYNVWPKELYEILNEESKIHYRPLTPFNGGNNPTYKKINSINVINLINKVINGELIGKYINDMSPVDYPVNDIYDDNNFGKIIIYRPSYKHKKNNYSEIQNIKELIINEINQYEENYRRMDENINRNGFIWSSTGEHSTEEYGRLFFQYPTPIKDEYWKKYIPNIMKDSIPPPPPAATHLHP